MAEGRAPRRCDDVEAHGVYGTLPAQRVFGARAYVGVPVELSNGARVGSLAAFSALLPTSLATFSSPVIRACGAGRDISNMR